MSWIAASDSLPENEKRVLLYDPTLDSDPIHIGYWSDRYGSFEIIDRGGSDGREVGEVTHWAELPEVPDGEHAKERKRICDSWKQWKEEREKGIK